MVISDLSTNLSHTVQCFRFSIYIKTFNGCFQLKSKKTDAEIANNVVLIDH